MALVSSTLTLQGMGLACEQQRGRRGSQLRAELGQFEPKLPGLTLPGSELWLGSLQAGTGEGRNCPFKSCFLSWFQAVVELEQGGGQSCSVSAFPAVRPLSFACMWSVSGECLSIWCSARVRPPLQGDTLDFWPLLLCSPLPLENPLLTALCFGQGGIW